MVAMGTNVNQMFPLLLRILATFLNVLQNYCIFIPASRHKFGEVSLPGPKVKLLAFSLNQEG